MGLRAENDPSFYLYVLECADGTWYTGYTVDVAERVRAHNAGAGAKYTRSRLPVRLLAQAAYATKHEAMSAEYQRCTRADLVADHVAPYGIERRAAREPFEQVLSDLMPAADAGEASA